MIKLKDYLGTLISGVERARVLADIESARIAKSYAQDDLLRYFPVPRFRAQEIEMDIPIAIEDFEIISDKDFRPIDIIPFKSNAYNTLKNVAKVKSFDKESSRFLLSEITNLTNQLERQLKAGAKKPERFETFSEELSQHFIKVVSKDKKSYEAILNLLNAENAEAIKDHLKGKLRERLLGQIKDKEHKKGIENANIIVEASKLREIKPENIIRIKMKLFEEGMEWHTMEDKNGEISSKLLPE